MQRQKEGATAARGDFYLDDWLVQPSLNRLSCGERTVHLRPKLMDVLVALAERAGQVVPKDELIEAAWAKAFLAASVLTRSIAELREALGDSAESPRYLETIPKRGYRVIALVRRTSVKARSGCAGFSAFGLVFAGRVIPLPEGASVIGRSADALVRIDSMDASRCHARIVVADGRAVLEDLGSKNGTFLRGQRVEAPAELADGDEISIGPTMLVFRVVGLPGSTRTARRP